MSARIAWPATGVAGAARQGGREGQGRSSDNPWGSSLQAKGSVNEAAKRKRTTIHEDRKMPYPSLSFTAAFNKAEELRDANLQETLVDDVATPATPQSGRVWSTSALSLVFRCVSRAGEVPWEGEDKASPLGLGLALVRGDSAASNPGQPSCAVQTSQPLLGPYGLSAATFEIGGSLSKERTPMAHRFTADVPDFNQLANILAESEISMHGYKSYLHAMVQQLPSRSLQPQPQMSCVMGRPWRAMRRRAMPAPSKLWDSLFAVDFYQCFFRGARPTKRRWLCNVPILLNMHRWQMGVCHS